MRTKIILTILMIIQYSITEIKGQQTKPELTLTLFSQGFTRPTDIKNCGDSRIFIVQQTGKITILDSLGNANSTPFLDITAKVKSSGGEQGLLGLAFSPNYKADGIFYVYYTNNSGPAGNVVISRFHRNSTNPDIADPTEEKLLEVWQAFTNHNGGDLGFGKDGYLYIGTGDGGSGGDPGNRAQTLDSLQGKILRIDVSKAGAYTIPTTNPFIDTPNARDEVWAYGLRNPWRWSFDRLTYDLWIGDVGQNAWEEVDFQPFNSAGGENYGWKCWEGNTKYSSCDPAGVIFPVYAFNHSSGDCSVTGGYVYRGVVYGDLFGRYLLTDYCSGRFMSIRPNGSGGWITDTLTTTPVAPTADISAFGEDYKGELYIAGNASGKIWKIGSKSCLPTALITNSDPVLSCGAVDLTAYDTNSKGLSYQWNYNDEDILNGTNKTYTANLNGNYYVKVSNGSCTSTSQTVTVKTDYCTGISDIINNSKVSVYPMPASTIYYIDINSSKNTKVKFKITDMFGRQVKEFDRDIAGGYNHLQMQLDTIADGIYFLIINVDNQAIIRKFVVSR